MRRMIAQQRPVVHSFTVQRESLFDHSAHAMGRPEFDASSVYALAANLPARVLGWAVCVVLVVMGTAVLGYVATHPLGEPAPNYCPVSVEVPHPAGCVAQSGVAR
ncbi:MAG: hypothetical protein HOQ24_08640 [Mycobacteriaceae bacterium]|nr:hypothetical protein [Mycobacteriaceae bacterium]